jgi:protein TonB
MSLDLFRPSTVPSKSAGRRLSALPISLVAHLLALLVLVVVPLLATGALPQPPREDVTWEVVPADMPTVPPPAPRAKPQVMPVASMANPDAAPVQVPSGIVPDDGLQRTLPGEELGSQEGVIEGGVEGGLPIDTSVMAPPPPRPAAPVRPGGDIREPRKILHVAPTYPPVALAAHVKGIVIIEAVIAPDGSVRDARVLRSQPLLDAAALDAVRQWRYTPTLLNGVPVPVVITVTVTFTLE